MGCNLLYNNLFINSLSKTMKEAIQKAIEGGWKGEGAKFNYYEPTFEDVGWYLKNGYAENENIWKVLSDPLFWQALGKSLGWGWVTPCEFGDHEACIECALWLCKWHDFIDHLAEGKDADDYFKELLK